MITPKESNKSSSEIKWFLKYFIDFEFRNEPQAYFSFHVSNLFRHKLVRTYINYRVIIGAIFL